MLQFIEKFFGGNRNAKEVSKLEPLVAEINEYAEEFKSLSDEELQGKTAEFKDEIREAVAEIEAEQADIKRRLKGTVNAGGDGQSAELSFDERTDLLGQLDDLAKEWITTVGQTLDELLPEAFAVVKETCRRMRGKQWEAGGATVTWDMVPYDVQLLGGIVLHQGRIAEMKTGEGKTLVAVAPVYLNALAGRGVHVVTVNPYLAQRDSEWMGPIFGFLGLTTACINNHDSHTPGRREAYRADITYGTNNEFGFDYLRDNSFVIEENQLVQRGHHFAIVDEVDSVLVDEARTPLIISGPVPNADEGRYKELKPSVERLVNAQKRLVATYVSDAERLMKKRDAELEAGNRKEASKAEEELGLALLRAQHGFSRNRKLFKLKQEPGIEQLIQRTENFYLQDNARNMPFVDEELYFVLNEKQRALEMTDKGRKLIADAAGTDADFFIIPDIGDETARMEGEQQQRRQAIQANSALSEDGRMEQLTEIANAFENEKRELYALYDERTERIHSVNQLLKAYMLFEKDVEYIVQDGKVQIVDEHTGRVLSGRRYSDGLHQAIEAKENVKVERATQTYATVTLQNYFRLYSKLSGMTGTAETEAGEFYEIYKLDVVVVPTNRPIAREDLEDLVFRTKREKYKAVIDQIRGYHEGDQPVLVGT
ncbi:MAG: preprotein translocase subunit SecA, partial [Bacteroidota bacterium]